MPIKANAAFAGKHKLGERRIEVKHIDAAFLIECFPANPPPGHPDRRKVGWYWRDVDTGLWAHHNGPFTSSRKAFKDAQQKAKDQ